MRAALGLFALCACASRAPAAPVAPAQWPAADVVTVDATPAAPTDAAAPPQGTLLLGARAIEANAHGACAVLDDQSVRCWEGGEHLWAPVGAVPATDATAPTLAPVPGARDVRSICLSSETFCALREGGEVRCRAQLLRTSREPEADDTWVVVEATVPGLRAAALHTGPDACVVTLGDGRRRRVVPPADPDAAWSHAAYTPAAPDCALVDGAPRCVGANAHGQLANEVAEAFDAAAPSNLFGLRGVRDVSFGRDHGCAVVGDGEVRCWGRNLHGQLGTGNTRSRALPTPVPEIHDARAVRAAHHHTCVVRASGEVWCWGTNANGLFGVADEGGRTAPAPVPGLRDVVDLRLSVGVACALRRDGTVWCWGAGRTRRRDDGAPAHLPLPVRGAP